MNITKIVKVVAQLSLAAAALGVVAPASAFTDCPGFPQTTSVLNTNHNRFGCLASTTHKGGPNPSVVTVVLNSNGATSTRRGLTVGLQGGAPIGPSCVAADQVVGGAVVSVTCPVRLDAIRMHIQTK
jgi:hypothetical protein